MTSSFPAKGARADSPRYLLARLCCACAIFSTLLGSTAPSPLYPYYLEQLNMGHAVGTVIFAVYAFGTLAALLLTSRAGGGDPRRMILPGLVLTVAGSLIMAHGGSLGMILLGRGLNGAGTGLITGIASATLFELAAPGAKRMAAIVATVAFTGGAAGGPLLSSAAIALDLAPTLTPFLVISGLAALSFAGLALARLPDPAAPAPPRHGATPPEGPPLRVTTQVPLFLLACLAVATAWMLGSLYMAMGSAISTELFGVAHAGIAGLVPALFQLCGGIGQAVCGRFSANRTIQWGAAGMAACQIAMVIVAQGPLQGLIFVLIPLAGLSYGAAFVGALYLASASAAPDRRASLVSRFYIAGYVANAVPTMLFGWLSDRIGLGPAFVDFSVLMVGVALLGSLFALRTAPRLA